jgi:putative transposase
VRHAGRGVWCVSVRHAERLAGAGVEPSVGSAGGCRGDALAGTINGLFRAEVNRRRGPWRSREAVEFAPLEWVGWFNNRRPLELIDNVPPAGAEARHHARAEVSYQTARPLARM